MLAISAIFDLVKSYRTGLYRYQSAPVPVPAGPLQVHQYTIRATLITVTNPSLGKAAIYCISAFLSEDFVAASERVPAWGLGCNLRLPPPKKGDEPESLQLGVGSRRRGAGTEGVTHSRRRAREGALRFQITVEKTSLGPHWIHYPQAFGGPHWIKPTQTYQSCLQIHSPSLSD